MSGARGQEQIIYEMDHQYAQQGIGYILDNASSLVDDSLSLLDAKRPYHVISLLEAAIQELGKAVMIQKACDDVMDVTTDQMRKGEIMTPQVIRIKESDFKHHRKKHDLGIGLLDENARYVLKQELDYSALPKGIMHRIVKHELGETLRVTNLYVNWIHGPPMSGWALPPSMTLDSFDTPQQIYDALRSTANAILEAIKNFPKKYR